MIKHNYTLVVSNRDPGIISEFNSEILDKIEVEEIKENFSSTTTTKEMAEDYRILKNVKEIGLVFKQANLLQDSPRTATNSIIK